MFSYAHICIIIKGYLFLSGEGKRESGSTKNGCSQAENDKIECAVNILMINGDEAIKVVVQFKP